MRGFPDEALSLGRPHRLLFDKILKNFGMEFTFVDTRDPSRIEGAVTKSTRAILVETPSNPLMRVTDLRAAADIAHRHSALLIVDNTFASPVFQRPFEFGADIVYHSTTKYLNGHSDMIGGIALLNDDGLAERLQFILNAAGAVPGPFDSWLALRGTKTLHLRMRQHDESGRAIARWLVEKLGAESVMYVGLPSHPQHDLAKRQMSGFGGCPVVSKTPKTCSRTSSGRSRGFRAWLAGDGGRRSPALAETPLAIDVRRVGIANWSRGSRETPDIRCPLSLVRIWLTP
jgi:cystathionine beta-lyase/cystathionine gamma-synthase